MNDPIRDRDRPPAAMLNQSLEGFLRDLDGPSWLQLRGRDGSRRRLVVTLLHGNEPSGIRAMHAWLAAGHQPAVDTVFYIGSVEAALADGGFAHRSLPGERDANRCYGEPADDRQGQIAAAFTARFRSQRFEALIDIHNNTGHNPAYGIGYGVDNPRLNLTSLFADWYVHSNLRMHTLVEMAEAHCPSISIECGRAGDPAADAAALAGLERFLHLDELPLSAQAPAHLKVLREPKRVSLRSPLSLAFADSRQPGIDLTLRANLDRHNFAPLPAGSLLGWLADGDQLPVTAHGASARDLAPELFLVDHGCLRTRQVMIPIMMTTDAAVARSDCLFYAMAPTAA